MFFVLHGNQIPAQFFFIDLFGGFVVVSLNLLQMLFIGLDGSIGFAGELKVFVKLFDSSVSWCFSFQVFEFLF